MKTWLKRVTTSLIATTLLFSTGMLAFAEPEVDTNTEIVATQTEHQSYDTLYIAVYVSDIMYSNNDIPDITLSITGKNGSDTLTLTKLDTLSFNVLEKN